MPIEKIKQLFLRRNLKTELVGMEPILDICQLTLNTTKIKWEKPVSTMILATSESGKTEALKKFRDNGGVIPMRRFSSFGIQKALHDGDIKPMYENPMILGHLLIYDFSSLFSFKMSTIDSTMSFLDAFTEEGLEPEANYSISPKMLEPFSGLKGGILAAINTEGFFTPEGKMRIRRNLLKGGFFSRVNLASYDLGTNVVDRIFDDIIEGSDMGNRKYVSLIQLPEIPKRVDVLITSEQIEQLVALAKDIRDEILRDLPIEYKGIRLTKILRTLAKSSALIEGRKAVNQFDIDKLQFLSKWMNVRLNPLKSKYNFYEGLD